MIFGFLSDPFELGTSEIARVAFWAEVAWRHFSTLCATLASTVTTL